MSAYHPAPLFILIFLVQDVPRLKKQRNYHPKLETLKGRYSSTVQVAFKSCPEKPWLRPFKSYKQFPSWETCAQYLWEDVKGKRNSWDRTDWHYSLISWRGISLLPNEKAWQKPGQEKMMDCLSPFTLMIFLDRIENYTDTWGMTSTMSIWHIEDLGPI